MSNSSQPIAAQAQADKATFNAIEGYFEWKARGGIEAHARASKKN